MKYLVYTSAVLLLLGVNTPAAFSQEQAQPDEEGWVAGENYENQDGDVRTVYENVETGDVGFVQEDKDGTKHDVNETTGEATTKYVDGQTEEYNIYEQDDEE